jgi:RHS repeat-associated protein
MTTKISKNTGDTTSFVWDIENKLTEVRKPGMIAKYTYDALGRRMSKTVNGETRQFRYAGDNLILEMNDQDSITASFTFGSKIDDPLMMNRGGKAYYYVKDGFNTVTSLADSVGNVVHEYKYSVYGKVTEETGDSIENSFAFTSREYDKETDFFYYRHRYYNPEIGRFISEDPVGINSGDLNFYRYTWNNPLNWLDPYGLAPGDPYPSARAAGVQAVRDINPTSIQQSIEYAGRVYQNFDGSYSYTPPNPGTAAGSNPGRVPIGTQNAGYYHTHGSNSNGVYDDEHFSPTDQNLAEQEGQPGFLGTPQGGNTVQIYTPPALPLAPNTGTVTTVRKNRNGGPCD